MKTLLASGAEVDSESGYLLSPFFSACCMGHYRTAEELYQAGADPHIPNGLFRNIWDPNELRQSVENCEACIENLIKNFDRNLERFWDLQSIFDEAAVQFKHMEQTSNAEEMYRRALAGRTRELGAEHPLTLASISNLASTLQDQGKYEEAEELYRRAREGYEKALGTNHTETLASTSNLASILQDQGKYEEAEEMYRLARQGYEEALGTNHPHTLASVSNLASILQDQGKYEEAEEMNRQVLEGRQAALVRASGDVDQRRYSGIATSVSRGRRRRLAIA